MPEKLAVGQRVTLVTGAGNGLGAAFAWACAEQGDAVVVNNRVHVDRPSSAAKLAEGLRAKGFAVCIDENSVDADGAAVAMVGNALKQFERLDAIILNAGISGPIEKIVDSNSTIMRQVMEINFFANAAIVEAALPHLLASPAGRIVLIASSAGLHGLKGRAPYASSKAALIAYGRTLALELARTDVRTNIFAPYAATKMTGGSGSIGDARLTPEKAACAAAWMASDRCRANGQVWVGGGGYFRRAATVEGPGGGHEHADVDWLCENAERIAQLEPICEPSGAEAAFGDFCRWINENR